ncbi:MAG: cytochrome c [Vicinamibacterales bacterium]
MTVRTDDPVSSSVTFNREIVRILDRKCVICHAPGGVAMSLVTYRDVRPWARAIREEVVEQRMPPWGAAQGYIGLANDPGLNARELAMILTWVDGGLPRGQERDLPRPSPARETPPAADHVVRLPLQRIPAGQEHVIRTVTVDPKLSGSRKLQRIDFRPGDRQVLRSAFVSVVVARGSVRERLWAGAWTPWQMTAPPAGSVIQVPAGAHFEVELHYRGGEADLQDVSSLELFFAGHDASASLSQLAIDTGTPSTGRNPRATGSNTLRSSSHLWAIVPRIPSSGQASDAHDPAAHKTTLEVTARRPDGLVQVLLWVPRYRPDWPTPYVLREPVTLLPGTTINVTTTGVSSRLGTPTGVILATLR